MTDEQFRILCQKLKETDSKIQTTIILLNAQEKKLTRLGKRLDTLRSDYARDLRLLRNRNTELQAQNMTLKQQNAEFLKFQ